MQEGLFHLSVKMVQRSKGRSATGAIAYRAGVDITDERTGLRFDYTRKAGVSRSKIILPPNASEKYLDRSTLWNTVEHRETRSNSAVAREFECALPYQLPRAVREQIGLDFAEYIVQRFGVAADINFHDPHPRENWNDGPKSKNYHFHLLTSTRVLTPDGFTDKVRDLDSAKSGSAIVDEIRAKFAELINAAYADHANETFVDHRSFERRGIDRIPTIHVGVNQNGDRAAENETIKAANAHLDKLNWESNAIQQQLKDLFIAQTLVGETIPLFALEPSDAVPLLEPALTVIPSPQRHLQQLEFDFISTKLKNVNSNEAKNPTLEPVVSINKHCRYRELEQLRAKAFAYGRACEHLRQQRSNAVSFQKELDNLEKPGLLHRLLNSRNWQKYERDRNSLQHQIATAELRATKLQQLAAAHRNDQTQWDKTGYFEHRQLAQEVGLFIQMSTSERDTNLPTAELSLMSSRNTNFGNQ
jgi:hypothetical protein